MLPGLAAIALGFLGAWLVVHDGRRPVRTIETWIGGALLLVAGALLLLYVPMMVLARARTTL